ncbi:MAG: hypothetical protein ABSG99_04070 [Sedimentisphaerales bacterium]
MNLNFCSTMTNNKKTTNNELSKTNPNKANLEKHDVTIDDIKAMDKNGAAIMENEQEAINLRPSDFGEEGLYLVWEDSKPLALTRDNIEQTAKKFWEDPGRISPKVKAAAEFQRCDFCPLNKIGGLCDAIRPTFPFLDALDKYVSHDRVEAVYKDNKGGFCVHKTTMQQALRYLSILSLVYYCQVTRKYWKHFWGIMPLMDAQEMAARLYLNFFYLNGGSKRAANKSISKFKEELTITSGNQVKRMNLVCDNDAFMNAFVNTQIITDILSFDIDKVVSEWFDMRRPADLPSSLRLT